MPTQRAIALRQQAATRRIQEAAQTLAALVGVAAPDLDPRHKNAEVAAALQLEAFAALLESTGTALAEKLTTASKAKRKTQEPAADAD